jgi:cobyrinic acid a,c-diamide synthase
LRLTHIADKLPHGKEIKVECGGMLGLQIALGRGAGRVEDIHDLFEAALDRYGTIGELPYSEIVKSVVSYQARQRKSEGPAA